MDFKDYDVSKITNLCANCGHDIDWHRFDRKRKPTACVSVAIDKDGKQQYCACNKFISTND